MNRKEKQDLQALLNRLVSYMEGRDLKKNVKGFRLKGHEDYVFDFRPFLPERGSEDDIFIDYHDINKK